MGEIEREWQETATILSYFGERAGKAQGNYGELVKEVYRRAKDLSSQGTVCSLALGDSLSFSPPVGEGSSRFWMSAYRAARPSSIGSPRGLKRGWADLTVSSPNSHPEPFAPGIARWIGQKAYGPNVKASLSVGRQENGVLAGGGRAFPRTRELCR